MKKLASMILLGAVACTLTGCGWFGGDCCQRCCYPCCEEPCTEVKPSCCPKPHVWDDKCCYPSHYDL